MGCGVLRAPRLLHRFHIEVSVDVPSELSRASSGRAIPDGRIPPSHLATRRHIQPCSPFPHMETEGAPCLRRPTLGEGCFQEARAGRDQGGGLLQQRGIQTLPRHHLFVCRARHAIVHALPICICAVRQGPPLDGRKRVA